MNDERSPLTAASRPRLAFLKPGRPWIWCSCGRSTRQPFCDGRSHVGTDKLPLVFRTREGDEEVLLCQCKQTATPPYCDGAHANLPGGYGEDTRSEAEREQIPWSLRNEDGVAALDGSCYVVRAQAARPVRPGTFWYRRLVAPSLGSVHQSQFYCELQSGCSPPLGTEGCALIFWFTKGSGRVDVSGRLFNVVPECGLLVRAGEQGVVQAAAGEPLCFFVSVCPASEDLVQDMTAGPFVEDWPERMSRIDPEARRAAGPRYFQMLVDKRIGSTTAAQFTGHIPPSRAAMHRHLYEEALIIMAGRGIVWNEKSRVEISAGDVVFLPRKHPHSLESLGPQGMDVVGIIHPGDNPGISY